MTLLTLSPGKEIHLTLSAAPFASGVEVQHTQWWGRRHIRRMRLATNDRNARGFESQLRGPNVASVVQLGMLALVDRECRLGKHALRKFHEHVSFVRGI